jgi:hypothetical protein
MSLERLGTEIRAKDAAYKRFSVKHAKEMGELYMQAKEEVKKHHKKWLPWLKETSPDTSTRIVGLYMQVATKHDELLATVANFENFSLKDVQKYLNSTSTRKPRKQKPSEPNPLTNVERAANQYQECLKQLLDTDLDSYSNEAVETTLEILASTESLNNHVRNELANNQRSSANCPSCESDLIGLESCIACGWNMGQLPILDCLDYSHN